jgi:predicted signal transduction protein with EAL and GGDEF domain
MSNLSIISVGLLCFLIMKEMSADSRFGRVVTWFSRFLLFLLAIAFLMFSLDVFPEGGPYTAEVWLGFFMHNVFTIALLLLLFVVWRWEALGGLLLLVIGVFMVYFFGGFSQVFHEGRWVLVLSPVLIGVLLITKSLTRKQYRKTSV